ncbi:MAG: GatB/YqeY domain-containing protein [Deltaproteobacteria bacterium]|nr:GatB/YqeY domain-containing protein [Deltaproteobacteria bacterium]MBW1952836.1 GatB/YqeY domain-containing protein [Deltaproteobacteria bacterium]MBW1986772.1 GatB/YqeY domain-containing protein [Deltaproteobacteria bacterium]MBW2135276.1 GatB/YqeY domain-containing protein [Deltaproteobacteria bacterium]
MSLYQKIDTAFTAALKDRENLKLAALRMVRAALKNREKEEKRQLTDDEIIAVISSQIKQRREASAEYTKAGRLDLAQKEEEELQFLLSFLPPQLSEAELNQEISAVIQEVGATGPRDLGKVMKATMARLAGRADGKVINELVRQHLAALS